MINISRTFTFIGIVTVKGEPKVSFRLNQAGADKKTKYLPNERTDFIALPHAMTKIQALNYAMAHPQFSSFGDQVILGDNLEYQQSVVQKVTGPKRGRGRPRKTAEVVMKPSLDGIRARMQRKSEVTVADVLNAIQQPAA